jgi:hypothetical protein
LPARWGIQTGWGRIKAPLALWRRGTRRTQARIAQTLLREEGPADFTVSRARALAPETRHLRCSATAPIVPFGLPSVRSRGCHIRASRAASSVAACLSWSACWQQPAYSPVVDRLPPLPLPRFQPTPGRSSMGGRLRARTSTRHTRGRTRAGRTTRPVDAGRAGPHYRDAPSAQGAAAPYGVSHVDTERCRCGQLPGAPCRRVERCGAESSARVASREMRSARLRQRSWFRFRSGAALTANGCLATAPSLRAVRTRRPADPSRSPPSRRRELPSVR